MTNFYARIYSIKSGVKITANGKPVGNGAILYDNTTLTVTSCSYAVSQSAVKVYSLQLPVSGSWKSEYDVYLQAPYKQRQDLVFLTGSTKEIYYSTGSFTGSYSEITETRCDLKNLSKG